MTEQEWLACADPEPMLAFLRGKASDRKLRLFAVACCRRVLGLLPTKRNREGLEVAERFADCTAAMHDLRMAFDASLVRGPHIRTSWALLLGAYDAATNAAFHVSHDLSRQKPPKRRLEARLNERTIQSHIMRDIFGNPFHPVTIDHAWRTFTVISVAQAIYDERAFDHLPILADALEDAGCDSADILNHCHLPGEHVRGCWAIDFVLQKK